MARGLAATLVDPALVDRFVTFYRRCIVLYDIIGFFIRFAQRRPLFTGMYRNDCPRLRV